MSRINAHIVLSIIFDIIITTALIIGKDTWHTSGHVKIAYVLCFAIVITHLYVYVMICYTMHITASSISNIVCTFIISVITFMLICGQFDTYKNINIKIFMLLAFIISFVYILIYTCFGIILIYQCIESQRLQDIAANDRSSSDELSYQDVSYDDLTGFD